MTSYFDPFIRWAGLSDLAVLDTETTGLAGEIIEGQRSVAFEPNAGYRKSPVGFGVS